AQGLVKEQDFGMINQRSRQGDALGHAAGKMMREGVGESFEADQAHEFVHLLSFLLKHAARDEASLDVATNRQPGKQVGILKNQTPFGARAGNRFSTHLKLTRVGGVKAGDEAKESGFAASARSHERNQFSRRDRERHVVECVRAPGGVLWRGEMFAHFLDAQRGAFGERARCGKDYHLMTPFCQTRTRSRTLNSTVMIVEKNAAMITRAA